MIIKTLILLILTASNSAYSFKYVDFEHTFKDKLIDQSIVFGGHLTGYLLTQQKTIREEGSFRNMESNLFDFHFDNDNTNWNYIGHIYTGSQVYLYYRSQGYGQNESFYLSFLSSLWFELFIETYTERPSIQDTFNTPIYGTALGYLTEKVSTKLLNSNSFLGVTLGRILNPFSLLMDDKKIVFQPQVFGKDNYQFNVVFYYD